MRPPGKPYTFPCSKALELKKEEPEEKLGFPAAGMTKSDNTATLSGQGPLKGIKEKIFVS